MANDKDYVTLRRLRVFANRIYVLFAIVAAVSLVGIVLGIVSLSIRESPSTSSSNNQISLSNQLSGKKGPYTSNRQFSLPKHARKISDDIYHLGKVMYNGVTVEGRAYLHRRRDFVNSKANSKCYTFGGATWRNSENYGISTANTQSLTEVFILNTVQAAISTWNSVISFRIFGNYDPTIIVDGPDYDYPDGKNEWQFGNILEPGVIAVTITWGTFDGPSQNQDIIEWDQVFDEVDYNWGDATITPNVMDLQNICTHETGHACGLGDVYDSACSFATMYGYASVGQISKRILSQADKTGLCVLYGECIDSVENTSGVRYTYKNTTSILIMCILFFFAFK
jgi:hypothetical protein